MTTMTAADEEISFALCRTVPAMPEGFAIHTKYGELPIAPGKLADKIASLVRKHYETELAYLALGQVAEQALEQA